MSPIGVYPRQRRLVSDRFWEKVNEEGPMPECCPTLGPCWLWVAATGNGYGIFWDGARLGVAHRWAYEHLVGPIPDGLQLDHLCRVRACVNPAHLEPVTQRENIARGTGVSVLNAAKTTCINGHEFTEENTYRTRRGTRRCRACHRANERRRQRAQREKAA